MADAGWHADPSGRHEQRYFDGDRWTDHVSNHGQPGIDPVHPPAPTVVVQPMYAPFPVIHGPSGNGLAVAGFVLAVIGAVFGLIPILFFLAWILGLLGLVFAAIGLARSGGRVHDSRRGLAIAGVILGIGALVLGFVGFAIVDSAVDELAESFDEAFGPIAPADGAASVAVGEQLRYRDNTTIQVHSYEQPVAPSSDWFGPSTGNEFGVIDIEVCASDTSSISYNPLAVSVRMPTNHEHRSAFADVREPRLRSGQVRVGTGCVRGFVTVEVPEGQRPVEIAWEYGRREGRWAVQ